MPQWCCWDPNHVGTFIYGKNNIRGWEPFTFQEPSPRRRQGQHAADKSRDQRALDLVRTHLHTAQTIISPHRYTLRYGYHVYDQAEAALNREWVPTMNNQVLASLGYNVDVRGFLHGIRHVDQRQLLYIGVFDASQALKSKDAEKTAEIESLKLENAKKMEAWLKSKDAEKTSEIEALKLENAKKMEAFEARLAALEK